MRKHDVMFQCDLCGRSATGSRCSRCCKKKPIRSREKTVEELEALIESRRPTMPHETADGPFTTDLRRLPRIVKLFSMRKRHNREVIL